MKEIIVRTAFFAILTSYAGTAQSQINKINTTKQAIHMNTDNQAVEILLLSYNNAINKADTAKLLSLFTEDGTLMPQKAPTAGGREQLQRAFSFLFSTFKVSVEFSIGEIIVSENYAFAQTTSKGTSVMQSTGQTAEIENKEIFILQKINGNWKILKYIFNQTN